MRHRVYVKKHAEFDPGLKEKHKRLLHQQGYDFERYKFVKQSSNNVTFQDKLTSKILELRY